MSGLRVLKHSTTFFGIIAILLSLSASAEETGTTQLFGSAELGGRPLQQIALTTTNLERANHFYGQLLGLPFLFQSNNMLFFDVGGTRLMIAVDLSRASPPRPTSILYFDTPVFETTLQKLKALPVSFVGPVETVQTSAAGDLKLQQFYDPDGNALAIMGVVPRTPATDDRESADR